MPFLINVKVAIPWSIEFLTGRNCISCVLLSDILPDFFRTICLVTKNIAAGYIHARKQINCHFGIMNLFSCQHKMHRIADCITIAWIFVIFFRHDFSQSTGCFLNLQPLFASALCGCALMDVLSIQRFS